MRPIRINGHRIPCVTCHRWATADYAGLLFCASCFRAFSTGLLVGRAIP